MSANNKDLLLKSVWIQCCPNVQILRISDGKKTRIYLAHKKKKNQ